MKRFYISKNYSDKYTASSKAKIDVEKIAANYGYINIGLPQTTLANRIGQAVSALSLRIGLIRIPSNGIFLGQYPTYGLESLIYKAKAKNNKVVIIVHDINCLRNLDENSLTPLFDADIIIAHNEKMKFWLLENGIKADIRVLQVFDYITNETVEPPEYPVDNIFNICFAGNLGKSLFLSKLSSEQNRIRVFGIGADKIDFNKNVEYIGTFLPDDLRRKLKSHFGLVWDGTSCSTCDGINGEYLKYIAPHKLSMYLSSNIPVIVWDSSAMAQFVKKNNIGFTIDNLNKLDDILKEITQEKYSEMVENTKKIGEKIRQGKYLYSVLKDI